MSVTLEMEEETESLFLEAAMARDVVLELLPRATRIYAELKEGSDQQKLMGEFILNARKLDQDSYCYAGQYFFDSDWLRENIMPVVLRWEAIMDARKVDREISQFLGTPGQAIMVEGEVTFTTSFEREWGMSYLTIIKDAAGNYVKYWNTFHVADPIQSEAQGQPVIRNSEKGDRIRFKATVKEHEVYKGVKGTVVQRARKVELIKAREL